MTKKFLKAGIASLCIVPVATGAALAISSLMSQGATITCGPGLKITKKEMADDGLLITVQQTEGEGYHIEGLSVEVSGKTINKFEDWFVVDQQDPTNPEWVTIRINSEWLEKGNILITGSVLDEEQAKEYGSAIDHIELVGSPLAECVDNKATLQFVAMQKNYETGDITPWKPTEGIYLSIDNQNSAVEQEVVVVRSQSNTNMAARVLTKDIIDADPETGYFNIEFEIYSEEEGVFPKPGDIANFSGLDFCVYDAINDVVYTPHLETADRQPYQIKLAWSKRTHRCTKNVFNIDGGIIKSLNAETFMTEAADNPDLDTIFIPQETVGIETDALFGGLKQLEGEGKIITKLEFDKKFVGLKNISEGAFNGFTEITNDLVLPQTSNTTYGDADSKDHQTLFPNINTMKTLVINGDRIKFEENSFKDAPITNIQLGDNLSSLTIEKNAFANCKFLKKIELDSRISINGSFLSGCTSLKAIDLRRIGSQMIDSLPWKDAFNDVQGAGMVLAYAPIGVEKNTDKYKQLWTTWDQMLRKQGLNSNWKLVLLTTPTAKK